MTDAFEAGMVDSLEKTAAYSHSDYMRNRQQNKMRSRQYRMRNQTTLRRKARIHRAKINRGAIRQKKRMGSAAGGYHFITR